MPKSQIIEGWLDDEPLNILDQKPKKPADWDDGDAPRKIPNPDFFEDLTPSKFEKIEDAREFAKEIWGIKYKIKKATEAASTSHKKTDAPAPNDEYADNKGKSKNDGSEGNNGTK
ncbi:19927_t:CDS:2, partial [Dentiscutata erythropus]